MKQLVLSQPNFLPWRGMFEQVRLSDVFVFYNDVQLPLGGGKGRGFITRVQIKTEKGQEWLSLPVARGGQGTQLIRDAQFADQKWRPRHLARIEQAYRAAPFFSAAYESIVRPLYAFQTDSLADFCMQSMRLLFEPLGITTPVLVSTELGVPPSDDASERVLAFCQRLGADRYITGHGAGNYLRHDIFEAAGVEVRYIDYDTKPYPQLHGDFTPYVSALDLIFNVGPRAPEYLGSSTVNWREWIASDR